jgi:glucose/arabinose dehydrogenase
MARRSLVPLAVALALAALASTGRAQETPKPEAAKAPEPAPSRPKKAPVMLRVQITIARYQAERKLASVPYTLLLTTDDRKVRLRMGVEVPIPVTSFSKSDDAKSSAVTSFQYKNVGTNIDCWAEDRSGDGLFQVGLSVENSSIYSTTDARTTGGLNETGLAPDRPMFRTFNVSLNPTLRDGQSIQAVASTDPVTGEVVKIDVTLNVVK